MPRYFFDIHDGQMYPDTDGQECASLEDVRREAMQALPEIAKSSIPAAGDRQAYTVIVRNEERNVIYTATLTFAGIWVDAPAPEQLAV